jgi:pyridoxine 4-dehydrogenase
MIMASIDETASGSFKVGDDITIRRLGFGAMRITGAGVWQQPRDLDEAIRTLKRLPELGVNFVDTAASYGPNVSENLIREALHPYRGMLVATKGGLERPGPDIWIPNGRPAFLRSDLQKSLKQLAVERIDLWQLHRIDPKVPADEQFGAIASFIEEGLVRYAGLSEVSVANIEAASKFFNVFTVQNRYNLVDRDSEDVLTYCERKGIGFIPWYPLAAGDLVKSGSLLDRIAAERKASQGQIALSWVLRRSPVMPPIPGKVGHLEGNVAAAGTHLTEAEFCELDKAGKASRSRS